MRTNQAGYRIPDGAEVGEFICACPHCGGEESLVVHEATLVETGERIQVGAPLCAGGFEFCLPDGVKDGSTADESVRCEDCRTLYPLADLTVAEIREIDSVASTRVAMRALHAAARAIRKVKGVSSCTVDGEGDSGEIVFAVKDGAEYVLTLREAE